MLGELDLLAAEAGEGEVGDLEVGLAGGVVSVRVPVLAVMSLQSAAAGRAAQSAQRGSISAVWG